MMLLRDAVQLRVERRLERRVCPVDTGLQGRGVPKCFPSHAHAFAGHIECHPCPTTAVSGTSAGVQHRLCVCLRFVQVKFVDDKDDGAFWMVRHAPVVFLFFSACPAMMHDSSIS